MLSVYENCESLLWRSVLNIKTNCDKSDEGSNCPSLLFHAMTALRAGYMASEKENFTIAVTHDEDHLLESGNKFELGSFNPTQLASKINLLQSCHHSIQCYLQRSLNLETRFDSRSNDTVSESYAREDDVIDVQSSLNSFTEMIVEQTNPVFHSFELNTRIFDIMSFGINWLHVKVNELKCTPSLRTMCVLHHELFFMIDLLCSLNGSHLMHQSYPSLRNRNCRFRSRISSDDNNLFQQNRLTYIRVIIGQLFQSANCLVGLVADKMYEEFENMCHELFVTNFNSNGGFMGLLYSTKNRKAKKGRWYRRVEILSTLTSNNSLMLSSLESILEPAVDILVQLNEGTREVMMKRFISILVTVYMQFFESKNNEQLELIVRMKRKSRKKKEQLRSSLNHNMQLQMTSDYTLLAHWIHNHQLLGQNEKYYLTKVDAMQRFMEVSSNPRALTSFSSLPESIQSEPAQTLQVNIESQHSRNKRNSVVF